MSKNSVWLEYGADRVLVDVGSAAEGHWRGLGYSEPGAFAPDQPAAPVEKPARKARVKKVVEELES